MTGMIRLGRRLINPVAIAYARCGRNCRDDPYVALSFVGSPAPADFDILVFGTEAFGLWRALGGDPNAFPEPEPDPEP